jgi:hypothetical protein
MKDEKSPLRAETRLYLEGDGNNIYILQVV